MLVKLILISIASTVEILTRKRIRRKITRHRHTDSNTPRRVEMDILTDDVMPSPSANCEGYTRGIGVKSITAANRAVIKY